LKKWSGEVLLLAVAVILIHLWQTRGTAEGEAPELSGKLLDGTEFSLTRQSDTPQLVHFWATWCPVCRLEMDNIHDLASDYPLITVAMRSGDKSEIEEYLQEHGLDFPVIPDPLGQIASDWGVKGVPASFVLDKNGLIRFVEVGYTTSLGLRLRLWWSELAD
jgi:thiol-disulfide isomerase/thioredoxin